MPPTHFSSPPTTSTPPTPSTLYSIATPPTLRVIADDTQPQYSPRRAILGSHQTPQEAVVRTTNSTKANPRNRMLQTTFNQPKKALQPLIVPSGVENSQPLLFFDPPLFPPNETVSSRPQTPAQPPLEQLATRHTPRGVPTASALSIPASPRPERLSTPDLPEVDRDMFCHHCGSQGVRGVELVISRGRLVRRRETVYFSEPLPTRAPPSIGQGG